MSLLLSQLDSYLTLSNLVTLQLDSECLMETNVMSSDWNRLFSRLSSLVRLVIVMKVTSVVRPCSPLQGLNKRMSTVDPRI